MWVKSYESVPSTMDLAFEELKERDLHDFGYVIAARQLAGRGRSGKTWENTKVSLAVSYGMNCPSPISKYLGLSVEAGALIAQMLRDRSFPVRQKWPNDIFTEHGKKLGGILIESRLRSDDSSTIVLGLGLNISIENPHPRFSALSEFSSAPQEPSEFATYFSPLVMNLLTHFPRLGIAARAREMYGFGEEWIVEDAGTTYSGKFVDLGPNGELALRHQTENLQFFNSVVIKQIGELQLI